ncbi:MAG TPA: 30S ribosomal protein S16 [Bacteroidetes bacterium]|nr:30S ribosomal protein S16 [Bacteroidota bacterium]
MAVRIRLRRVGKKKMPVYHIVAADSRTARSGKFLEIIGRYDPLQHPLLVSTKDDRVFHWLKVGALPTDTVRSLFQRTGLWLKWGLMKKGSDETTIAAAMEKWQMAQAEKLQRTDARKVRRAASRKAKKKPAEGAAAPPPVVAETKTEA